METKPPFESKFSQSWPTMAKLEVDSLEILYLKSPEKQLFMIQFCIIVTSFTLLLLFLLGFVMRRACIPWLTYVTKSLFTIIAILISFIIGLMHTSNIDHELFPIWALLLVFAYGGVDTMIHNDYNRLNYFIHTQPLWFGCGVLMYRLSPQFYGPSMMIPLVALWSLTQANILETMEAFKAAKRNKYDGLQNVVQETVSYMREDSNRIKEKGYLIQKAITTEEVRSYDGELLKNGDIRAQSLKDLCLSFAFHKILLVKLEGLSMNKRSLRAESFAKVDLLSPRSIQVERALRAFRIIEVEIQFVFDFFYTKYYILSKKHFAHKLKRLLGVAICLWFAFVTLHKNNNMGKNSSDTTSVGITRTVMFIYVVIECLQFNMTIFSNWMIVRLVCKYVNKPRWLLEMMIKVIWDIKDWVSRQKALCFFVKPWQRKLGQYSFLKSYGRIPLRQRFMSFQDLMEVPRPGQKGHSSVTLSTQVKSAIISSLTSNFLQLCPGTLSLQRNEMDKLFYCEFERYTRLILVWHIATDAYVEHSPPYVEHSPDVSSNFHVATSLSRYCAYLVTFSSELLPDHTYDATKIFDNAVEDANATFAQIQSDEQYKQMVKMPEEHAKGVVRDGFVLAKKLKSCYRDNGVDGWRVLAEFWAELILFLAPSDNATAHIEHLAQGGEFITHLWALLTHIGIVSRDPCASFV